MRHSIEERLVEVVPPSSNGAHSNLIVLYRLRSTAKNCNRKDINAMLIKHNFYDSDLQENIWTCDSYEVSLDWNLLDVAWYVDYADGYISKHYNRLYIS